MPVTSFSVSIHRFQTDPVLVVQVDGGDDSGDVTHNAGGVSAAGQIFGEVDVSGAKLVDGAVAEADLRLAGEGDQVLPAGSA